jgi:hypothetical protein
MQQGPQAAVVWSTGQRCMSEAALAPHRLLRRAGARLCQRLQHPRRLGGAGGRPGNPKRRQQ